MKAIVCTRYGPPDALELKEVAGPSPGDNDVLVEVCASSVNYNNLGHVRGRPLMVRLRTGLLKPEHVIPGNDVAGRVEAVGRNVTQFRVGDEVYGNASTSESRDTSHIS